jgi:ATP-dependent DNA ligase
MSYVETVYFPNSRIASSAKTPPVIWTGLPLPAKAPPSGPGWLHEIKHDGFRIMARRTGRTPDRRPLFPDSQ